MNEWCILGWNIACLFIPLGNRRCNIYGIDYLLDLCAVLGLAWSEYVIPFSLFVLLSDGLRVNLEHSI